MQANAGDQVRRIDLPVRNASLIENASMIVKWNEWVFPNDQRDPDVSRMELVKS